MSAKYVVRGSERGVTSLFIVIFAAILLSIITVSFIAMMVREQQRSTDNELSQSAYDAALAGVEDGKRVMIACRDGSGPACNAIAAHQCTTVIQAGIQTGEANGEVILSSSTSTDGRALDQAYTCVIVRDDTEAYIDDLLHDESIIFPIRGTEDFSKIRISWHTEEDNNISSPTNDSPNLPQFTDWQPTGRPALMRVQLMQYSEGSIPGSGFDSDDHARTIYLYPDTTVGSATFGLDARRTSGGLASQPVRCESTFPLSGYACQATLDLPGMITNRTGYLRLTSLYVGTHFQVELLDGADDVVPLDGVQPAVDSTGRANDLFRRVEARIQMGNAAFPYPRATVDITNNFCKVFSVASTPAQYADNLASCDPSKAGD